MKLLLKSVTVLSLASALFPTLSSAQHYTQKNLVSDISQPDNADGSKVLVDPNLKNPWGITRSSSSPWWISNNNSGTSTLYVIDSSGNAVPATGFPDPAGSKFDNFVIVPPPGFTPGAAATPTGIVFNGSPTDFILDKGTPPTNPAAFIFAKKTARSPAGVRSTTFPPAANPLRLTSSSRSTTPATAHQMARFTRARPLLTSMVFAISMSPTSAPRASKFTTPISTDNKLEIYGVGMHGHDDNHMVRSFRRRRLRRRIHPAGICPL